MVQALNTFTTVPDGSCVQSAEIRAQGAYAPTFGASSGAAGDPVTASGYAPFPPRGEGGQYVSPEASSAQVWWNDGSDIQGAAPPQLGPATKVGEQNTSRTCGYSISFTVPNVAPGVYPVTVREAWSGGYSEYGEENFHVTG